MLRHIDSPRRRLSAAITAVAVIATVLIAMPGTASAQEAGPDDLPPGKAWVRVGHFVPGMGAATIDLTPLPGSAEPATLASGATYGSVSAYKKLTPGNYTATVRLTSSMQADPLLSRSFEISAGDSRSLAVLGTAEEPRLALLSDDLTPPAPGTARVRLLSASEQANPLTVKAVDGPTVAEGAVLGQATQYATVPAGSWTLRLQSESASASIQDVAIASGSVYTVVALDSADEGVELQVVTDAAGAVVAPQGGADTGVGSTVDDKASAGAVTPGSGTLWAVLLTLAVAGLWWGAGNSRRRVVPVQGRP